MADEADRAGEYEAKHLEAALSHRKPVPRHTGCCLNCGDKVGRPFCDAGCSEDYERFEKARARNGRQIKEEE